MDPYYEQRLRDEVIYLHSLWHQGPPTNTYTYTNANTFTNTYTCTNTNRKRVRDQWSERPNKKPLNSNPQPDSTTQWPCPTPIQDVARETSSGWPAMKPISAPSTRPMSAEEQARHSLLQLQYKALDTCRKFFSRKDDSDIIEDDDEWDKEGDDDDDGEKEEFDFFLRLFMENNELRTYYEENSECGEFVCLVCGGLEKKNSSKRIIKGCFGLVQHSVAISKTRKKRAHRTFGKVICRVMGWDIDRLPMIVAKGEPLGRSLAKAGEIQGEPEANAGKNGDVSGGVAENALTLNVKEIEPAAEVECEGQQNGGEKLMTCEVSSQPLVSTAEWPCEKLIENSPSAVIEWPTFKPHSASATCSVSAEDQSRFAALQLQQKAMKTCQDFFSSNSESDSDEFESQEEDNDNLTGEDGWEDCDELMFFSRIFTEDHNLRSFYENNYERGDFYCLVCAGIGKKIWKRFTGCVALVRHSTAISKTKKMLAHRAYGNIICKVLGWDIKRVSTSMLEGKSLGQSSAKSDNLQGEPEEDSDCCKDGINFSEKDLNQENGEAVLKDYDVRQNDGTSIVCDLHVSSSSPDQSMAKPDVLQ